MTEYSRYLLPVITQLSGQASGSAVFELKGGGPICILEYLTFDPPATAGTVTVQTSPDQGVTWDDMATGGTFNAADASSSARVKPQGRGLATHVRITFSGIVGATDFVGAFTKGV